jgi:sialidase-1
MTAPERGAHEPSVVELDDGRLLCFLRTTLGRVYEAFSEDGGETWSEPEPGRLVAPDASPVVKRIPQTGDLIAIWNDNYEPGHHHAGERTPLAVAVSGDEGESWGNKQYLEIARPGNFSTPTVTFFGEEALFTYYACRERMGKSHHYGVKLKIARVGALYC